LTAVMTKARELAPDPTRTAKGHLDFATGSGTDATGLAIAYEGNGDAPADLAVIRQWKPPFDPAAVAKEAAALFRKYDVFDPTIDRFAPGLVRSLLARDGIDCQVAERDTSAMLLELMALINCRAVRLLDVPALLGELRALERRPSTGGREVIGHPGGGHDDVAAAAAGALVAAARRAYDGPPLMLFGGEAWQEWEARRTEATVEDAEVVDDESPDERVEVAADEEDPPEGGWIGAELAAKIRDAAERLRFIPRRILAAARERTTRTADAPARRAPVNAPRPLNDFEQEVRARGALGWFPGEGPGGPNRW
jgi:hypothetical protein